MRVGFGYDVHRLVPERKLVLGGVEVGFHKGLAGHSDADVLIHAVIDALFGAAGLGDIGRHFPPTDDAYKDISSVKLLEDTAAKLVGAGFVVGNVDATIVCEAPKLKDHIPQMEKVMAAAMGCDESLVNVKATTTEGLGATGRGEGIAAYAVALVDKGGA